MVIVIAMVKVIDQCQWLWIYSVAAKQEKQQEQEQYLLQICFLKDIRFFLSFSVDCEWKVVQMERDGGCGARTLYDTGNDTYDIDLVSNNVTFAGVVNFNIIN